VGAVSETVTVDSAAPLVTPCPRSSLQNTAPRMRGSCLCRTENFSGMWKQRWRYRQPGNDERSGYERRWPQRYRIFTRRDECQWQHRQQQPGAYQGGPGRCESVEGIQTSAPSKVLFRLNMKTQSVGQVNLVSRSGPTSGTGSLFENFQNRASMLDYSLLLPNPG